MLFPISFEGISLDQVEKLCAMRGERLPPHDEEQLIKNMLKFSPHARFQGMCLNGIDGEELSLRLPYRPEMVGDPETGAIHTGPITVLLDHCLGLANITSDLVESYLTVTLDLRIDHLGYAPCGTDLIARAKVYRATRRILFVEGYAFSESQDQPVARATGSFILMPDLKVQNLPFEEQNP